MRITAIVLSVCLLTQSCTHIKGGQDQSNTPPPSSSTNSPPSTSPSPTAPPSGGASLPKDCLLVGDYRAVDLSMPVDQAFLTWARGKGVKTIIRYGDYTGQTVCVAGKCRQRYETIKGKVPSKAEMELIRKNGFCFLVVFQHNNRWANSSGVNYGTFNKDRGTQDAQQMQRLYPDARSWYYGVDFDAYLPEHMKAVEEYGRAFKAIADKYGKAVGAYGGGKALTMLSDKGLIKYRWISMSTGFSGTKQLMASGDYHLLQKLDAKGGGKEFDPNTVKVGDFGQW